MSTFKDFRYYLDPVSARKIVSSLCHSQFVSCHFKTCSFCLSNLKTHSYFCLGYASRVVPPGGNLGWKMRSIFQSERACRLNWKRWQAWIWNGISYQTFLLLLKIGNIPLKLKSNALTSACEVHISAPLALSQNGLASWNMSVQCEIRHLLSVQLRSWAQRSAQPFLCHQGSTRHRHVTSPASSGYATPMLQTSWTPTMPFSRWLEENR